MRTGNCALVRIERDDALGEEVVDGVAARRHVGGEHVIEAAVLADDHDDVLDGRGGLPRRAQRQLRKCERAQAKTHRVCERLRPHEFLPNDRQILQSALHQVAGRTRIVPIIPPSSCSSRWQWYTNVPTVSGSRKSMRSRTLGYWSVRPL